MPEGDTIHHLATRLRPLLEGNVPREILTPHPRHTYDRWPQRLQGRAIAGVEARGKHLLVRFEGQLTLHSHLRMTGAWGIYRDAQRWRRAPSRAWLVLRLARATVVQFDGPVLELLSDSRARADPRLCALGPDILAESFDERAALRRLFAVGERTLGEALLDQRALAGIGNVWKSEACFAVGVSPWRALSDTSSTELLELLGFARERMGVCVREGALARPHAVYRRAGMPCPRCGAPIRSRRQGDESRLTYWCEACQR